MSNRALATFLPLVPAAMLCLVAGFQVHLTRTNHLTPWKGGGFGMFSTNDHPARQVHVWIRSPSGERWVALPESSFHVATLAAIYPSPGRLATLGRRIAAIETTEGRSVSSVRVQVWRTAFSPSTLRPRLELVRETVITP